MIRVGIVLCVVTVMHGARGMEDVQPKEVTIPVADIVGMCCITVGMPVDFDSATGLSERYMIQRSQQEHSLTCKDRIHNMVNAAIDDYRIFIMHVDTIRKPEEKELLIRGVEARVPDLVQWLLKIGSPESVQ
jgi:hypothetical protein